MSAPLRVAPILFARRDPVRPVLGFVWDSVTALAAAGLEVEPIVLLPASWARGAHLTRARQNRAWPEDLEARLLALWPKPTLVRYVPWPNRSIEAAAFALSARLVARRRSKRPEVLLGSFLDEGGFAATISGEVLGAPAVAVAHGSDVRAALGELEDHRRRARALRTLRRASRVLTVSRFLAGRLGRLGVSAEVVPWTTRADRFPLSSRRADPPVILFVGHIGRGKGVDLLLRAFAALPRKDVRLRLVGAAAGDLDVGAEARALGIAERVEVLGPRPEAALADLYANASMTVLPSRHEGLGVVLVESLLVGRPVIGAEVGGIVEIAETSVGATFPSGDVPALAAAMARVLERLARGELNPSTLRARALPWTWEVSGARLAACLEGLV